eukprot:3455458-Alexandrium_andersonii.AAC.1
MPWGLSSRRKGNAEGGAGQQCRMEAKGAVQTVQLCMVAGAWTVIVASSVPGLVLDSARAL